MLDIDQPINNFPDLLNIMEINLIFYNENIWEVESGNVEFF